MLDLRIRLLARALASIAVLTGTVTAQEARFLVPERFDLPVFESVGLRVEPAAEQGAAFADVAALFARAAGNQRNVAQPRADGDGMLRLAMPDGGVALLGFDAEPRVESVEASRFRDFLTSRSGARDATLSDGMRSVRVRRIECGKALVRVRHPDDAVPHSATAQSKSGQAVEIRPLADPTGLRPPSDLPLRIYLPPSFEGPAGVTATHVPSGRSTSTRTDTGGIAVVRLDRPGAWRIEAHAARAESTSEWTVATATLTFEVRP